MRSRKGLVRENTGRPGPGKGEFSDQDVTSKGLEVTSCLSKENGWELLATSGRPWPWSLAWGPCGHLEFHNKSLCFFASAANQGTC